MKEPVIESEKSTQIKPSPTLERRSRRKFSVAYKTRMVQEASSCSHGELGALLRRENLYSSQIQGWRRELESGTLAQSKTSPGPRPAKTKEQRQIEQLENEVKRLRKKLALKDDCLELQKKALSMLEKSDDGSDA